MSSPTYIAKLLRDEQVEHLAPPVHREALLLGAPRELAHGARGRVLVGRAAPVEGGDRVLVLRAH
ncbi:MAG TPA: hypothetical protein VED41_11190, partial [Solirubrobacteraceae bacterium]|nr:hypothetical protein [Solirubrobacteraceae bacterium]